MISSLSPEIQRACLQALGRAADTVGFDVPLAQYTQAEALQAIHAVIRAYEREQASKARVLRGLPPLDDFEDCDVPF